MVAAVCSQNFVGIEEDIVRVENAISVNQGIIVSRFIISLGYDCLFNSKICRIKPVVIHTKSVARKSSMNFRVP